MRMHRVVASTLLAMAVACAGAPGTPEAEVDCTHEQTRDTDPDCWPSSRELSGALEGAH